jgi:hypothetical protein
MMCINWLCSICQACQMTKKEHARKKYGLLPPKIEESDTVFLGHGMCGSGRFIYNKGTIQNTNSLCFAYTHNDRLSSTSYAGLKMSKPQISQQHPSRICFITAGWHITCSLNLFSMTIWVWENSNVISNKYVCMTIILLMNKKEINLCLAEIWITILPSEQIGVKSKKQDIINKSNQQEN